MKRREFIEKSTAVTALASIPFLPSRDSSSNIKNIGTQLFWLGGYLENDLEGGFKLLSEIGYREVQLYGPYVFYTEEGWRMWNEISSPNLGFRGCGLFGKKPEEFAQLLKSYGLSVKSLHSDLENLEVNMPRYGEMADKLGIKYVVMPFISPDSRQNLDDFKKIADRFNRAGELAREQGLVFTYHNHGPGWTELDGEIPAKYIFDNTDPELVKLELDIYWIIAAGQEPERLLEEYKGRVVSLHLADMKELKRFSGDGSNFEEILELFPNYTVPGLGVLNIENIVHKATQTGVELYYLEQIPGGEIEGRLRSSYDYLSSI